MKTKRFVATVIATLTIVVAIAQEAISNEKLKTVEKTQKGEERGEENTIKTAMPAFMDPNHVPTPLTLTPKETIKSGARGETGYGWNAYSGASGIPTGPVNVALPAGTLTIIQPIGYVFMTGGDWANGVWYAVSYSGANNSGFYTVDHTTGNYTLIGNTGFGMTGLAFDITTQTMYASRFDGASSWLYTVDMSTGQAMQIGFITTGIIAGIAADASGNLFAIHLETNRLWAINKDTGTGTQIGLLGVSINYAQDIGFDRDNDILYGTLYSTSGGFYSINTTTGEATLLNNFIAEVCAFAIPYNDGPSIPISLWAIYLGIALMIGFVVIRYRRIF